VPIFTLLLNVLPELLVAASSFYNRMLKLPAIIKQKLFEKVSYLSYIVIMEIILTLKIKL
jgi:hypothetical protein